MTHFENNTNGMNASEISKWIKQNLKRTRKVEVDGVLEHLGVSVGVSMNRDGSIKDLNIDLDLTPQEEAKLISKFPELAGKRVQS